MDNPKCPPPLVIHSGEVLFYTVGDWHLCKRDHYDKPMRRAIVPPAATVHFPLGRILVK